MKTLIARIRNFIAQPRPVEGTFTVETDTAWHQISLTDWDAPVRVFAKPVPTITVNSPDWD